MSDITDIETLVRYQIDDSSKSQAPGDIFTYGSSSVFTLSEPNVLAVSAVLKNDVELGASEYSFDSSTNKVTVSAALSTGDTIEIQYTYYEQYSSTQVESAVRSAVVDLSVNNYCTFEVNASDDTFYPDVTDKEKNLLSFIASIRLKPDNVTYRLPDITINAPKGSLPTRDMISKAISIFKNNTHGVFNVAIDTVVT